MAPSLIKLVHHLIDEIEEKQHFDLMDDFASVIPIEVIGNLLNIAPADRAPLRAWSAAILGALEFGRDTARIDEGNRAVEEFVAFLKILIAKRRAAASGDDIVSRLLRYESDAFRLSEAQVYHQCIFLLNAGHETTTNLIGNGIYLLMHDDAARTDLQRHTELIDTAVEEFLRFEPPVQLGNRITTQDVTFDDIKLEAGTTLTLCIGGANRDPAVFDSPESLNIRRNPNPQLAFAGGIHACAGMAVARLEAKIAISNLLHRCPSLTLNGVAVRSKRTRFRGFETLPMRIN